MKKISTLLLATLLVAFASKAQTVYNVTSNTAGQVLQEHKSNAASSTVSFDVSSYSAGTYMIQVIQTDGSSRNNVLLIAK